MTWHSVLLWLLVSVLQSFTRLHFKSRDHQTKVWAWGALKVRDVNAVDKLPFKSLETYYIDVFILSFNNGYFNLGSHFGPKRIIMKWLKLPFSAVGGYCCNHFSTKCSLILKFFPGSNKVRVTKMVRTCLCLGALRSTQWLDCDLSFQNSFNSC